MKNANIFAGVVAAFWSAVLLMGVMIVRGAYSQHEVGFPNSGQVTYYVWVPAFVVSVLTISGVLLNRLKRWPIILTIVAFAALVFLLSYISVYTGGI